MGPSIGWVGLSVFRLGTDDLLAVAPAHPAAEADDGSARSLSAAPLGRSAEYDVFVKFAVMWSQLEEYTVG
jgi:hypothetical protein